MDKQSKDYLSEIIENLKNGYMLIFFNEGGPIFKGKGEWGVPNGEGRWVFDDGAVLYGDFDDLTPIGKGKLKIGNNEFEGEWKDGKLILDNGLSVNMVNLDQDMMIVQKGEDGEFSIYQGNPLRDKKEIKKNYLDMSDDEIRKYCKNHKGQTFEQIKSEIEWIKGI